MFQALTYAERGRGGSGTRRAAVACATARVPRGGPPRDRLSIVSRSSHRLACRSLVGAPCARARPRYAGTNQEHAVTPSLHQATTSDGAVALSVMIPNFNYGRYIGETIESVLAQELGRDAELEIVVCDNASTDDSVSVVRGYRDPRIRL